MTKRLDAALAARKAGRTWADVAALLRTSVPEARTLLEPALAARRRKVAVVRGAHAPDPEPCHSCKCPRALHTRRFTYASRTYDDACTVHTEHGYDTTLPDNAPSRWHYREACDGYTPAPTPESARFSELTAAAQPGHTRSTWYYLRKAGVLTDTHYRGGSTKRGIWYAPPELAQQARESVQVRRAQKKARRVLAREFPNGRPTP